MALGLRSELAWDCMPEGGRKVSAGGLGSEFRAGLGKIRERRRLTAGVEGGR